MLVMSLKSSLPLKILFVPLDVHGHVNPCIGIAETLRNRGHHIIFAIRGEWKGKLSSLGFDELIYRESGKEETEKSIKYIKRHIEDARKNPFDQISTFMRDSFASFVGRVTEDDAQISVIVHNVRPDIIITDRFACHPSLVTAGVPWVWCVWQNPIAISTKNAPPMWTGLPTKDRTEWDHYRMEIDRSLGQIWCNFNSWIVEHGAPPLTKEVWPNFVNPSPYLNLYVYPEELDYTDLRGVPEKWFRCDSVVRTSESDFQMPKKLQNKEGKLIYFSMGSIGSADVQLMKRLVNILAKSPHRFIVSKGRFGDEYELPDNMWGDSMVSQTKVLPLVDLVISHGGNNTLTECFYFGKPMIILPHFADQFDNAQRIRDKNFGITLDAHNVTEKQLLDAIESTLHNENLILLMRKASERIQKSNTISEAAKLIESLKISS